MRWSNRSELEQAKFRRIGFDQSVKESLGITMTQELYMSWINQILSRQAEFIRNRGPVKSVWKIQHNDSPLYVVYRQETYAELIKVLLPKELRFCEGGGTRKDKRAAGLIK